MQLFANCTEMSVLKFSSVSSLAFHRIFQVIFENKRVRQEERNVRISSQGNERGKTTYNMISKKTQKSKSTKVRDK